MDPKYKSLGEIIIDFKAEKALKAETLLPVGAINVVNLAEET